MNPRELAAAKSWSNDRNTCWEPAVKTKTKSYFCVLAVKLKQTKFYLTPHVPLHNFTPHFTLCRLFQIFFLKPDPTCSNFHFLFAYRILEHYLKKLNRHGAFNSPKLTRRTYIFCILIIKLYTGKKQGNILDVLIWQKCQFFFSRQIWSILYWCSL